MHSLFMFHFARRREHGAGSPQAKRKSGWSPRAATLKDNYQTEPTTAAAALPEGESSRDCHPEQPARTIKFVM